MSIEWPPDPRAQWERFNCYSPILCLESIQSDSRVSPDCIGSESTDHLSGHNRWSDVMCV